MKEEHELKQQWVLRGSMGNTWEESRSGDELHRCDKEERQIKDEVWGWVSNLVMEY